MKSTTLNSINLTPGESQFLLAILAVCGNTYPTLEQALYLRDDNYSWFSTDQLIGAQYSKEQVGGFMSSLEAKGLLHDDGYDKVFGNHTWCLTERGVEVGIGSFAGDRSFEVSA